MFLRILFTFMILLNWIGYSQTNPIVYNLEKNLVTTSSYKINPEGNSIGDVITNGDTLWLRSGVGLSKLVEPEKGWINFGRELFGDENVFSFDYKNGIICCATGKRLRTDVGEFDKGSGIKLSTDGGNSWYSLPQSVDEKSDSIIVYGINKIRANPIFTPYQNISYDLAITSKHIWTANYGAGLRRISIDSVIQNENPKWERIILPPDSLSEIKPSDTLHFSLQPQADKIFGPESYYNHRVFSILAIDDALICAGTASGINISTDGGTSWKKINYTNSDLSGNWITSLEYNYSSNTIWAAAWKTDKPGEYESVCYSSDYGNSWTPTLNMKANNLGFIDDEVLVPTDNGLFRSSNLGKTWISVGLIKDSKTQLPLNTNAFSSATSQNNIIWLGSENGLVRFEESNQMWIGDWKIYLASQPLTTNIETYAFPNPFSPDVESVKIKYSTSGKRQSVTIRIFDFGMNLIKTVIQNAERGNPINSVDGDVVDYWNGRDELGNIVPNGVYFYRIDLIEGYPVFGKIMVLL